MEAAAQSAVESIGELTGLISKIKAESKAALVAERAEVARLKRTLSMYLPPLGPGLERSTYYVDDLPGAEERLAILNRRTRIQWYQLLQTSEQENAKLKKTLADVRRRLGDDEE